MKHILMICLLVCVVCPKLLGSVRNPYEAKLTRAAIMIQKGSCDKASALLRPLLARSDRARALNAICLRRGGRGAEALKQLEMLAAKEPNKSGDRFLGYQFNIGVAKFKTGNVKGAASHFQKALVGGFKPRSSHYFLGRIDLAAGNTDAARSHLVASLGASTAVDASTQGYLAEIAARRQDQAAALRHLVSMRTLANDLLRDNTRQSLAKRLLQAAQKNLKPYDAPQSYRSAGLFLGYDSNVFLSPALGSTLTGNSGDGSLKTTLAYGLGYRTSPVKKTQYSVTFNGAANYNFSSATRLGQFWSNTVGGAVAWKSYERMNYGISVSLGQVFRNSVEGAGTKYKGFLISGSFAPYLNLDVMPNWVGRAEVGIDGESYTLDSQSAATSQRSGHRLWVGLGLKRTISDPRFNPSINLQIFSRSTRGTEFNSSGAALTFGNGFTVGEKIRANASLHFAVENYNDRAGKDRHDFQMGLGVGGAYSYSENVTVASNLSYVDNDSNEESLFKYSRFEFSVGANYFF